MRAAVLAVLLVGAVNVAQANDSDDQATVTAQGKARYRLGTQLYDLGKYAEAATEYEAAFRLTDRPALLFNIGQAHRLAGNYKAALAAYRGFLRRDPTAPQRPEVEEHIANIERDLQRSTVAPKVEVPKPPPVTVTTPEPATLVVAAPAPAPRADHHRAMWIGIGVGAGVLVATGAVLLGVFLTPDPLTPYPGNVSPGVVGINP